MDADRKKVTWDYLYKYMYTEKDWDFWGLLDFDMNDDGSIGWKSEIKWNNQNEIFEGFKNKYPKFRISGDTDFGMKDSVCNTYIEHAEEKMHMFHNFSLMPKTGGMNNKKGAFGYYDRFDEFIYYLSQYFKESKEKRYEYAKENLWYNSWKKESTLKPLCDFLDLFPNVYDYCNKIYFIDNKKYSLSDGKVVEGFVGYLIEEGEKTAKVVNDKKVKEEKKKIVGVINAQKYCELAEMYWGIRTIKMKKKITDKAYKEYFYKNIAD